MPVLGEIHELLARTALFGEQPEEVIGAVGEAMRRVRFTAGQVIFQRGDPGNSLYLVAVGRVRLSILTPEGREFSFAHAIAGEIFGEIAVLDGACRSADATALDDVTLLYLSAQQFDRLVDDHNSLARAVIRFLCRRIRDVSDHFEDVALLSLEARLARFLLDRAASSGADTTSEPNSGPRVNLGISQGEIAMLMGASRQKVNAALMLLEQSGAIRRTGGDYAYDALLLRRLAQREERW